MSERSVYFDHNAMAPLRRSALAELLLAHRRSSANSSSVHRDGMRARAFLDESRASIAHDLHGSSGQLVFTSGGTEANNLAIFGSIVDSARPDILISPIEHPSVLGPAMKSASRRGGRVRLLPITTRGVIDLEALRDAIDDRVGLVSIQCANHETGVVQPIRAISTIVRTSAARFHTDAVQFIGRRSAATLCDDVDAISLTAHKLGGPPGIGALWLRDPSCWEPQLLGGAQEFGLRSGTASPALASSFAVVVRAAVAELDANRASMQALREILLEGLRLLAPEFVEFSTANDTLENTLCVAFPGIDRFALTIQLDLSGIRISPGAACSSGSPEPSPVLRAMGVPDPVLQSAIRISLGPSNTREDCEYFLDRLPKILAQCRSDSLRFSTRA